MTSRSAAFSAGIAAFHLLASAASGPAEAQQVGNVDGDGWSIGLIGRIGSAGQPGKAQLDGVAGAVSLRDGTIAVLNSGTAEIRLYSEDGEYQASLGREGEGPGEFISPAAITLLPADTLAVLDAAQRRVTLFASDGTVARTIPLELPYGLRPFALSSFSDGTFGVATLRGSRPSDRPGVIRKRAPYVVVNRSGAMVDTVAALPGDAWYFHVFDSGASRLDYLPFGPRTHTDALNGRVYVAVGDSSRIHGFDPRGATMSVISVDWPRVGIGSEDIEAYERRRLTGLSGPARPRLARVLAQIPYPELGPAVSDIVADTRGYLWVRRYAKPRADAAEWHVFTPTGRRAAVLRLPAELDILDIRVNRLLALTRDELDREIVEIYRILRPPSSTR